MKSADTTKKKKQKAKTVCAVWRWRDDKEVKPKEKKQKNNSTNERRYTRKKEANAPGKFIYIIFKLILGFWWTARELIKITKIVLRKLYAYLHLNIFVFRFYIVYSIHTDIAVYKNIKYTNQFRCCLSFHHLKNPVKTNKSTWRKLILPSFSLPPHIP